MKHQLNEHNLARYIPEELFWGWLAMDINGNLYAYVDKPNKYPDGNYVSDGACKLIGNITDEPQYQFFVDNEPFKISNWRK